MSDYLKQSVAVGKQNRVLNNSKFSWTLYLIIYYCSERQEGWKLTEEGRLSHQVNPLTYTSWDPLIAWNHGLD